MSTVADRVASEGIAIAYEAYEREEQVMWERYAELPSRLAGRRYLEGEAAAHRELDRRVKAEVMFAINNPSGS